MQIVDLAPDLILTNGRIYTLDAGNPQVTALAVKDGRVIAGGGDDVAALAGPHTEILDLGGRTRCPASSTATTISCRWASSWRASAWTSAPRPRR
ncbi:MAG: hypothetical protein R3A10_22180 [Caldilineaceae bacterium]